MYLLIPDFELIDELEKLSFTFHNVSINSDSNGRLLCGAAAFTFHNVSINSILQFPYVLSLNQFTFHNVSINSLQA